jgi:hypothetical protein
MTIVYIIGGGILFYLLQKLLLKFSPKFGWYAFLSCYLLLSVVCIFFFAHFTAKFTTWQRVAIVAAFIIGTVLRIVYYRGRFVKDNQK